VNRTVRRWTLWAAAMISIIVTGSAMVMVAHQSGRAWERILQSPAAAAFSVESLERDIATYDRLGPHRTGTDGNLLAARWLESEFAGLGYRVRIQRRVIPTYLVDEAFVEVLGERIQAFPQFPVPRPDAHEHMGALGEQIPILRIPNRLTNNSLAQAELQESIRGVAASGAKAVILEVAGACGDIKSLNAPLGIEPWDAPVLLVAGEDAERLALLGEQAETARVRLMGRHTTVDSINVIAEIGPASAPAIVVSTPLSGWFHATAERGSGIGAFLSIARWASAEHGNRRFVFTANSGHELGDAGAHAFLESEAPPPEQTRLWLHIGANVGSRHGEEPERPSSPRFLMSNASVLFRTWAAFRGQDLGGPVPLAFGLGRGELAAYFEAGYRPVLGVFGPGPFHHCSNDRLPGVHLGATRGVALGFATLIETLTRR
jgi:hypothetical protein